MSKDIGGNTFYNMLNDPQKGVKEKTDGIIAAFDGTIGKGAFGAMLDEYNEFRDFVGRKKTVIDKGLGTGNVEGLLASNAQLEDIVAPMFYAEEKIPVFGGTPSMETTALYTEIQWQGNKLTALQNGEELSPEPQMAKPEVEAPAAVTAPIVRRAPVVPRVATFTKKAS